MRAGAAVSLATFSTTFEVTVTVEVGRPTLSSSSPTSPIRRRRVGRRSMEARLAARPSCRWLSSRCSSDRFIHEAGNAQALLSALEGTALLVFTIWNFPAMWRNKRLLREKPYLLMCFFYTGGFVIGFSAILNLGLLARQRVQVLPMFFVLIAGLAWDETKKGRKKKKAPEDEVPDQSIDEAVDELVRRGPSRTALPSSTE